MKLFSVIKWALFLLLLIAAAVGVGGIWVWQHSDGLVEQQLLQRFELAAPDLLLRIGRTRLLSASVLRLEKLEVLDRRTQRPLLRTDELTLTVDETELFDRQRVLVRSVEAHGIDVILTRQEDGRWNWQDYRFVSSGNPPLAPPSVMLHDMRALVNLEHGAGVPPARLLLLTRQFQAIPASHDSYDFLGDVQLPEAGALELSGDWDLKARAWKLGGRLRNVPVGQRLMDVARSAEPGIDRQLQQLDELLTRVMPPGTGDPVVASSAVLIGTSDVAPRFLGVLDVDFGISGSPAHQIPEFLLKVDVRDGQLSSSAIADQLTDISATIFRDNSNLIVRVTEARDGDARIAGELRMVTVPQAASAEAQLHVERFPVDRRLQPFLPEKARPFFDRFLPRALVTGDVTLRRSQEGRWVPIDLQATIAEGRGEYHRFRYPVTDIAGTVRQRSMEGVDLALANVRLDVEVAGRAGQQPVTIQGFIRNPGPESEMRFDIAVNDLPLDSHFRDALEDAGRKVIDSLNLSGLATARAECYREPGLQKPMHMLLKATVTGGGLKFRGFPWEISSLTGNVEYDTRDKRWVFQNLQGRHGDAELAAEGIWRGLPQPGTLDLQIHARNGRLDSDLYNALGESQQRLWTMLQPSGRVNLTTTIHWTSLPGHKAVVRLPRVEVLDAQVFPAPFPYRMNIASAVLSFDPNDPRFAGVQHCEIQSLKGDHRGAPISASGWVELTPDQFWQLHLNDLSAARLQPDDELRAALPESWRETLSRLSQQGFVSVESSQLDFRGRTTGDVPPTAAWELNLRLEDCAVTVGLPLDRISGLVLARGTWDGRQLKNTGEIRLDTVEVMQMPLSRVIGPYSIDDDELLFGSRAVFTERDPVRVPPAQQLQAQAYGGSLLLDGLVDLSDGRGYRLFGTVNNALLESYAARHLKDQPGLRGVVNSWVYLKGEGDSPAAIQGGGQLQISPAALYELPLMVKMLSALGQLNPSIQNRTAFDYALLTFEVHDKAFWFDPVDLVGDSLALRGRGSVGFGGDVVLDFYSRPAQPRTPSIPLVNALLFTGATQWVAVQVRGTVDRPQTEVKTAIQLDESMRQFLSAFQPNPNGPIPGLKIPGKFGLPQAPQAFRNQ
jgi:hypothetical protein